MATFRRFIAAILLAFALAAAAPAPAAPTRKPEDFALIYATVYGPSKLGMYGIAVKVRRANEKKPRWQGTSDHAGEVAFRVPVGPGDYVVWADVKTPKGHAPPETKVHVEGNERVDVSLHLTE